MPESNPIQQEIAQLEQQIREKREALERAGQGPETLPTNKELVHQAIGEKIQQQSPQYTPQPAKPVLPVSDQPSYLTPELKDQVQQLVNAAFSQGLQKAITQAVATQNPALIDAFHDFLVDELYTKLVELKQIPTL